MNATYTATLFTNHFESAFVLVAGHLAFDSGCCTWHDDDSVDAEVDDEMLSKGAIKVFSRYGDNREDDAIPDGLHYVSAKVFMDAVRGVKITVTDPR